MRVLSNTSMEYVQRDPDSTVSIFKIGSTSPASLLFDALNILIGEVLRYLSHCLPTAVLYYLTRDLQLGRPLA